MQWYEMVFLVEWNHDFDAAQLQNMSNIMCNVLVNYPSCSFKPKWNCMCSIDLLLWSNYVGFVLNLFGGGFRYLTWHGNYKSRCCFHTFFLYGNQVDLRNQIHGFPRINPIVWLRFLTSMTFHVVWPHYRWPYFSKCRNFDCTLVVCNMSV